MLNTIHPQDLKRLLEAGEDMQLLDVRRKSDYEADPTLIPGAQWRNPEDIEEWSKTVSPDRPAVIYCVKGGSVSKSVSEFLQKKQIPVRYLEGGLQAWKSPSAETKNNPS